MRAKQDRKREAYLVVGIWQPLCVLLAIIFVLTDAPVAYILFFQISSGLLGIVYAVIAYLVYPKKVPSKDELIYAMRLIKAFPVQSTLSLAGQYRFTRYDQASPEEQAEVNLVQHLAEQELFRGGYPAFEDDYKALNDAYNSGEFHKAMRYASVNWLKAILIVASSKYDPYAHSILDKHFGIRSHHWMPNVKYPQ